MSKQLALFPLRPPVFGDRHDQIEAAAIAFHEAHGYVWRRFCDHVRELREAGVKDGVASARDIWGAIRIHALKHVVPGDFALNNNYTRSYARWYNRTYECEFFRVRECKSKGQKPRRAA